MGQASYGGFDGTAQFQKMGTGQVKLIYSPSVRNGYRIQIFKPTWPDMNYEQKMAEEGFASELEEWPEY